jgi:hypothetical protein
MFHTFGVNKRTGFARIYMPINSRVIKTPIKAKYIIGLGKQAVNPK